MGVGPFSSSSSCRCRTTPVVHTHREKISSSRFGNPNPSRYSIKRFYVYGIYVLLEIHYPDCKNFEGNKILLYRKNDYDKLSGKGFLDPHFCNNHSSPIARFVPTPEGWEMGLKLMRSM